MPIYEYQCRACGHRSEEFQKMSDPPLTTCESCGGELKKLISAPAVQFKGSGWYVTDYAKSGGKSDAKSDGGSSDSAGTSSEGKGDSKGESKSSGTSSGSESGSGGGSGDAKPAAKPAAAGSSD